MNYIKFTLQSLFLYVVFTATFTIKQGSVVTETLLPTKPREFSI